MSSGRSKLTKSKRLIKYLDKVVAQLKAENEDKVLNTNIQKTATKSKGQHTSSINALFAAYYLLDLTTAINTARGFKFNYIVNLYIFSQRSRCETDKFINISSDLNLDEFIRHLLIKGKFIRVHINGYEVLKKHTKIKQKLLSNPLLQLCNKEDDGYEVVLELTCRDLVSLTIKERLYDDEQYENTIEDHGRFIERKKAVI